MEDSNNKKSLFKLSVGESTPTDKDLKREAQYRQMQDRFGMLDAMTIPTDMPSKPSSDIEKKDTSTPTSKKESSTDVSSIESSTNNSKSAIPQAEEKPKKSNLFDEIASFTNDIPRIELEHSTGGSILSIPKAVEQREKPSYSDIEETPQSIELVECDKGISHISEIWSETPCGIIECQVPDIGATYLEMHSDRDSIIVFPDENKAFECSKEYLNSLYINKEKDLSDYMQNHSRHKFIVTSKYAGWLLLQLSKDGQEEELLNRYFFMVKDMEQLQKESTYKAGNGNILDLYLKFPNDNRAIYTTDHKAFTHPVLREEAVHIIKWRHLPKRNIRIISRGNIIGALKDTIENMPTNDKILVVYTSIQQARLAILNLKEDMQKECCIWCKDFNKDEAGEEFFHAIGAHSSLPKRITFLGSRDYNLQVKDKCHLITVSDTSKGSTLMSIKDIVKVHSLCKPTNILSDTVIHNEAAYHWQWEMEINTLVERAEKIVKLLNTADELSEGDNSLVKLFSIVKTILSNKATGRIRGRLPNIKLIRKNCWGKHSAAYMNMDSLLLRINLCKTYYSKPTVLAKALKELYSITSSEANNDEGIPEAQQEIEKKEKKRRNDKKLQERIAILDEILELHKEGKLDKELKDECKRGNSHYRKVCKEVAMLYPYMGTEELIDNLKRIDSGNRIGFNNFNNKVIYWSLVENHPLRLSVNEAFKVGERYTNVEIREKMSSIIQYHFHRDWSGNTRKPVTLFKCFFETERPKREYIIRSELDFKQHKDRIEKNEDNLLKLFIISDTQANKKSKKPQSEKS